MSFSLDRPHHVIAPARGEVPVVHLLPGEFMTAD